MLLRPRGKRLSWAQYPFPMKDQANLLWIIIDQADNIAHQGLVVPQLLYQRQPRGAGPIDERSRPLARGSIAPLGGRNHANGQPAPQSKEAGNEPFKNVHRMRNACSEQNDDASAQDRSQRIC